MISEFLGCYFTLYSYLLKNLHRVACNQQIIRVTILCSMRKNQRSMIEIFQYHSGVQRGKTKFVNLLIEYL